MIYCEAICTSRYRLIYLKRQIYSSSLSNRRQPPSLLSIYYNLIVAALLRRLIQRGRAAGVRVSSAGAGVDVLERGAASL
jgi:hypothetical protein